MKYKFQIESRYARSHGLPGEFTGRVLGSKPIAVKVRLAQTTTWIPKSAIIKQTAVVKKRRVKLPASIPGFLCPLYDFQKEGAQLLHESHGHRILADEMGLGKTPQALAYAQMNPTLRPVLIICPENVKWHWATEISKWIEHPDIYVINGFPKNNAKWKSHRTAPTGKNGPFIIINYDIIANRKYKRKTHVGWAKYLPIPDVLILDEAHYLANPKAKRTKAITQRFKTAKSIIPLTGTPIEDSPIDFFPLLRLVNKIKFKNLWDYKMRYCNPCKTPWGWEFKGVSNVEELHELTSPYIIRRKKEDVLKDLPAKRRMVIPVELSEEGMAEYSHAEDNFLLWLKEHYKNCDAKVLKALRASSIVQFNILKQLAMKGKFDVVTSWIEDYLAQHEKLVVFAYHRNTVTTLVERLQKYSPVYIMSGVKDRKAVVDAFQNNNKVRLFTGTIGASSEGVTLTQASDTCTIELGWGPLKHDQAEDRVHRIGQKSESVGAYYLLGRNTVEEKIAKLIDTKRKMVSAVLDGKLPEKFDLLTELLKMYTATTQGEVSQ